MAASTSLTLRATNLSMWLQGELVAGMQTTGDTQSGGLWIMRLLRSKATIISGTVGTTAFRFTSGQTAWATSQSTSSTRAEISQATTPGATLGPTSQMELKLSRLTVATMRGTRICLIVLSLGTILMVSSTGLTSSGITSWWTSEVTSATTTRRRTSSTSMISIRTSGTSWATTENKLR